MFFGEDCNTVEIVNGERIDILKYICLQPIYTNVSKLEALDNVLNEQYNEDFIAIYNSVGNMFKGLWKQQYIESMNNEINKAKENKQ